MKSQRKFTIAIVILSLLLAISLVALAVIGVRYNALRKGSTIVPGNEITKGYYSVVPPRALSANGFMSFLNFSRDPGAESIQLYRAQPEDGQRFDVPNMFPGDSYTKEYTVRVSYWGNLTVRFRADILPDEAYQKLAEVLNIKVSVSAGGVAQQIYEGLMRDMPEYVGYNIYSEDQTTQDLTYFITVYLDTSVGNEYQAKTLLADFRWWVPEGDTYVPYPPFFPIIPDDPEEEPEEPDVPVIPDEPDEPDQPDDPVDPDTPDDPVTPEDPDDPVVPDDPDDPDDPGELVDPPPTSDTNIIIWIGLACIALIGISVIMLIKNREEEKKDNE